MQASDSSLAKELHVNYLDLTRQVEFQVVHGETGIGFVAIDDIIFEVTDDCTFTPAEAWPTQPSTTLSTPIPTEPPDCKFCISILMVLSQIVDFKSANQSKITIQGFVIKCHLGTVQKDILAPMKVLMKCKLFFL